MRYVSHKIYDGKPSLPGLPATFDREGKAQTLEVETLDAVTGLKATLLYTVFEDYPVLAKSVRLENTGSAALTLERAFSSCLELPTMDLDIVQDVYKRQVRGSGKISSQKTPTTTSKASISTTPMRSQMFSRLMRLRYSSMVHLSFQR